MSDRRLIGEIAKYPWLALEVRAQFGTREIAFLVDTGFDGEIAIPRAFAPLFGMSDDVVALRFADGEEAESMIVPCRVNWIGGFREASALYIDGDNPLLGMEMLEDCLAALEIESGGGQIIIEPNL